MGEEPSLPHFADHQPGSYPHPVSPPSLHSNGAAHLHNEEEPYTIKCICGFADDDGNTVLCEQCETWQHIECYYYPTLKVPDVHKCVECLPRILDSANATQRQKRLREGVNGTEERKARRAGPKTHKRSKTKEPGVYSTHQVNGLSYTDRTTHERASGSPRDQPPASKRPKTSHRNSGSVSANISSHNVGHHSRTGSSALPLTSPVKPTLADCPPDYFSSEFINVHQTNTHFTPAQTNLFLNIGVSDLLSMWLDDPQAFAQATHGKSHADVFKQHPTPIEELETPVQKCVREDTSAEFHGNHPVWPYLVADRDLFEGHFVGELIGSIGHLQDYKAEPSNNWDRLRHPDHFVFFHPHLPIYIDCRTEGTILRYARRSCRPNIKMETIITGAREYHFCFIATRDIPEGAELTVAWDLESDPQLRDYLYRLSGSSSSLDESQREYLVKWVETVLAHFGDCACPSFDGMCLMERFDHRVAPIEQTAPNAIIQRKRQAAKTSPSGVSRQANSRAGSEARFRGAAEEEFGDTTSSPRSSRSRTSREPTPMSYDSAPHGGGPELSERDKKKLLQQEKLFQKIEQEEQGQRKKKRRSGSTLHTPSAATFKQPGRSYFSNSNPDTPAPGIDVLPNENDMSYFNSNSIPSPSSRFPLVRTNALDGPSRSTDPKQSTSASVRPTYADASAQTEPELPSKSSSSKTSVEGRPYVPLSQRLLRRNHLNRLRKGAEPRVEMSNYHSSPILGLPPSQLIGAVPYTAHPSSSPPNAAVSLSIETGQSGAMPVPSPPTDAEVHSGTEPRDGSTWQPNHVGQPLQSPHPPLKAAAQPWPGERNETQDSGSQHRNNYRTANFHVDLPPSEFQGAAATSPSTGTSTAIFGGSAMQSPLSAGSVPPMSAPIAAMAVSLLTPNYTSVTQPSPIKKKMSLSDYSQRLKAKTPSVEKTQGLGQTRSASPSAVGLRGSSVGSSAGEAVQPALADGELGTVKREPETPQF